MNTLENVVYTVSDLDAAKAAHIALLGTEPHTDQPYYVGFNIDGIEIGLTPAQPGGEIATVAHIRVPDMEAALEQVTQAGATVVSDPRDVGGGTRVAAVRDAGGTTLGLIAHAL
jgi:predicted enzyme related to lactoylglutathione lyase